MATAARSIDAHREAWGLFWRMFVEDKKRRWATLSELGVSPQQFAAEGGEDFELLVALPPGFTAAPAFAAECGLPLTRIGSAVEGSGARFSFDGDAVALTGFSHFG